ERESYGADLRVGEDHPRRRSAVRAELHLLAEDGVRRESRLVLPHVREQGTAVDIADRVEPGLVPRDTERVVDPQVAARLDADCGEPDVRGARAPVDRDDDLVRLAALCTAH